MIEEDGKYITLFDEEGKYITLIEKERFNIIN